MILASPREGQRGQRGSFDYLLDEHKRETKCKQFQFLSNFKQCEKLSNITGLMDKINMLKCSKYFESNKAENS